MPDVGTSTALTTAGNIIMSIRDQIPDKVADPASDGTFVSLATLLRWINDAMRIICVSSQCIIDWYAIASAKGMDVYELPVHILSTEQLWYDLWPCWRAPELDALFVTKIQSRSYFFGSHSVHSTPRLHVWPAADRTGATTTLSTTISATATSVTAADSSAFKAYGFFDIEGEIFLYRNNASNVLSNILRGQGGTTATAHTSGATITERNIFFKCSRLATAITGPGDVVEIPVGLTPLIELYVLGKVRQSEQEFGEAKALLGDFNAQIDKLTAKAGAKDGIRQGLQVRTEPPGPLLYYGRVFVP